MVSTFNKNLFLILWRFGLIFLSLNFVLSGAVALAQTTVAYDIVYVKAPRFGDEQNTRVPEVFDPIRAEPGTDLVLLHPDGTEEVLVAGGEGVVMDPYVSFDGKWVYYAKIHDQTNLNSQRRKAARSGADIFKINLETREIIQLTFQEWTPNTGVANWSSSPNTANSGENYLGYGIYNLAPCPLPGGKIMFSSSRNGFLPNKSFTFPNLQLYVMDDDGKNVELIGHLNLGSALHPTVLKDGRVMFSSYEAQGNRSRRLWGIWAIWPDGRHWEPLMSAFNSPGGAFHWQTQLSDGSIVVTEYYNLNNNGFGSFFKFPATVPPGEIAFGDPVPSNNPSVQVGYFSNGKPQNAHYSFPPFGMDTITKFANVGDSASPYIFGDESLGRAGKVTQPSGAPNNDLLLVYSPGPANSLNRPTNKPFYDMGLYIQTGGQAINDPRDLVLIKNDPNFNEQQPRAVVSYRDIYGVDEPVELPWLPNDGSLSPALPAGTPFGLIGTSSFYKRDTKPGNGQTAFDGLDPFNTYQNGASSNWGIQGSDAGKYNNSDIHAVRILTLEPTSHLSYGPNNIGGGGRNFKNTADERMRILGEIPLRKFDAQGNPILDPEGNPDTSFLAKIPADTPFTFQTIDKNGTALNTAQTWHQVRPGEVRTDCGGCHAHSQQPLDFSQTAAAQPGYVVHDLAHATPLVAKDLNGDPIVWTVDSGAVDVEYYRDIKPILQRSCVQCHSINGPAEAGLVLDDESIVGGYENTYNRLANDSGGQYGIPSLVTPYGWRQTNQSRYIRSLQSRRSLLAWKVFGERLDGWTNEDHPSAAVPGDASTLPGGGSNSEINRSDIDFTGTIMPPPGSGVPPLSDVEKMFIARWIDLGTPITRPEAGRQKSGWFGDDLRPTLVLSSPRAGVNQSGFDTIRVSAFDYYSGINGDSVGVFATFPIPEYGRVPGDNLVDLFQHVEGQVWEIKLPTPIDDLPYGEIIVQVSDVEGNVTKVRRSFSVAGGS